MIFLFLHNNTQHITDIRRVYICEEIRNDQNVWLNRARSNPDMPCHCKQRRSRSVGFFRSQLIWICTVCHSVCGFISTIWIKYSNWLTISSKWAWLVHFISMKKVEKDKPYLELLLKVSIWHRYVNIMKHMAMWEIMENVDKTKTSRNVKFYRTTNGQGTVVTASLVTLIICCKL